MRGRTPRRSPRSEAAARGHASPIHSLAPACARPDAPHRRAGASTSCADAVGSCAKVGRRLTWRRLRGPPPYRAATVALWLTGAIGAISAAVLVVSRDVPALASAALMGSLALAFNMAGRRDAADAADAPP